MNNRARLIIETIAFDKLSIKEKGLAMLNMLEVNQTMFEVVMEDGHSYNLVKDNFVDYDLIK